MGIRTICDFTDVLRLDVKTCIHGKQIGNLHSCYKEKAHIHPKLLAFLHYFSYNECFWAAQRFSFLFF